jgi:lysophospholipase L1-like esterase
MPRPFRALSLGVALVLATLGTATPATASNTAPAPVASASVASVGASSVAAASASFAAVAAPPLPDSVAAIGDSITQAVDVCCFYGNWPSQSWSTGFVPLDGIASHYERVRAQNPRVRGNRWNNAVSGARMADAPRQARATVRQGAEYVTILMGANDLCRSEGTLTPTATFRAQFTKTLGILRAGLPGSHVFVASIPNLYQLWSILRVDPVAQAVWQGAGICPSMLRLLSSPAGRRAFVERLRELNDVLRDVCATWSRCRFDNYLTYNYDFTRSLVSKLDYFHPSRSGQATLASLTWNASWWG